jgi:hypothetical protein
MIARIARLTFCLIVCTTAVAKPAVAKPYGPHDLKTVMVQEVRDGKMAGRFDLHRMEYLVNDLAHHALHFPPMFDTPQEFQQARNDANQLAHMFEVMLDLPGPDLDAEFRDFVTVRLAVLHTIRLIFNQPNAANKALDFYERGVERNRNNPQFEFYMGSYLSHIGKITASIELLNRANSGGEQRALYPLGVSYLQLNQAVKAKALLEQYKQLFPADQRTDLALKLVDRALNATKEK